MFLVKFRNKIGCCYIKEIPGSKSDKIRGYHQNVFGKYKYDNRAQYCSQRGKKIIPKRFFITESSIDKEKKISELMRYFVSYNRNRCRHSQRNTSQKCNADNCT